MAVLAVFASGAAGLPAPRCARASALRPGGSWLQNLPWNSRVLFVAVSRYVVLPKDFDKGYKKNVRKADTEHAFYSA